MALVGKHLHPSIEYRQGANLPHWRLEDAIYAITFRLADSLPKSILDELRAERARTLKEAQNLARSLTAIERKHIDRIYGQKVEEWLDRGSGSCILRTNEYAAIVRDSLLFRDQKMYSLYAWCVMPTMFMLSYTYFRVKISPRF
jgi:hypothetical protein